MREKGFTLVELLLVIVIIAVLAVLAVVIFRGVTNSANDTRRKADLNNIIKAYELKYQNTGQYQALTNEDFTSNSIPKTPEGGSYTCLVGPDSNCVNQATDKVAYCVLLGDNKSAPCISNSSTCFCTASTQGTVMGIGGGGGGTPSCDPYLILNSGLVGYWKFDQTSWNGTPGEVIDSSGSNHPGKTFGGTLAVAGKTGFGNAAQFDGVDDYIEVPATAPLILNGQNESVFLWVKHNNSNSIVFESTWRRRHFQTFWQIIDTTSTYRYANTTGNNDNQWHMIGYTVANGNTFSSYRDNIRIESKPTASLSPSGTYWWFGRICGGSDCNQYYTGQIDEVRIYNRALSTSEVNAMYNNGNGCFQ